MKFKKTVACSRPAMPAWTDSFGNTFGLPRPAVYFDGVFVPPTTDAGSRIVDEALRQSTVTKPTVFAEGRPDVRSGDPIVVDGDTGWQVDGDPAAYTNPFTGYVAPLVIELRRTAG